MKSTHTKFLLMGAFLASIIFIGVGAAPAAKQSGMERYIPTKLEWLVMRAEATKSIPNTNFGRNPGGGFSINFLGSAPNTVSIFCVYTLKVEREAMNHHIFDARRSLKLWAKQRGWNWLKIKEELTLIK